MNPRLSVVLLALSLAACGSSDPEGPGPTPDAGTSVPDAGTEDAGVPDAGTPDAGAPDAGPVDSGTPDAGEPDAGPPLVIPKTLSGYGLFTGSPADGGLVPVEGNVPYTLSTPLFSDYSVKSRTLYIPPGKTAHYQPMAALDLPVGTLITKTFAFPADLRKPDQDVRVIETRVLVRQPSGWEAWPYVWNEAQTEATQVPGGGSAEVTFIDLEGETRSFTYAVPSKNQCQQCHHLVDDKGAQVMHPIGVKARYLHRTNTYGGVERDQLEYLASLGKLDGLPAAAEVPKAPDAFDPQAADLTTRARTYLDINCAHCHNPKGTAGITSQLFLDIDNASLFNLGECKRPGSAGSGVGGEFDILPGNHAESILWYRLHTVEDGKMMPQIGRTIRHEEGSQLIADWIDSMPAKSCK
ncbi:SO2930 family diheme c-type cytochrome [Corallococcus exercitus]|uniref:SO2930 family diheme c-type cytochrome n=1 Tax=Corallococcus exercitus TaxID=2316736 RepID=UPI0035D4A2FD